MIPLLHAGISERFRDKEFIIKRYINSPSLLYFTLIYVSGPTLKRRPIS